MTRLSLTIMLVMYTMYQSINGSLTTTAYLKMIDFWLLFCLLVPFVIFLIQAFWLSQKSYERKIKSGCNNGDREKKSAVRKVLQGIVPAATLVFIIAYSVAAVRSVYMITWGTSCNDVMTHKHPTILWFSYDFDYLS